MVWKLTAIEEGAGASNIEAILSEAAVLCRHPEAASLRVQRRDIVERLLREKDELTPSKAVSITVQQLQYAIGIWTMLDSGLGQERGCKSTAFPVMLIIIHLDRVTSDGKKDAKRNEEIRTFMESRFDDLNGDLFRRFQEGMKEVKRQLKG